MMSFDDFDVGVLFFYLSRLDEMSYGTFHVQYGFKNKVTEKIPLRLTND